MGAVPEAASPELREVTVRLTPEEIAAYRRAERQRMILGYAIQVAWFLIRHWRFTVPALFLLVFLVSFDFISLLMLAASVWVALKVGRGPRPVAQVEDAYTTELPGHLSWLPHRWLEIAREAGLTRPVLLGPDRLSSLVARFNGVMAEDEEGEAPPPIVGIFEATVGIGFEVQMFEGQELKHFERASEVMKNMFSADGALNVRGVRLEQPVGSDIVKITLVTRDPLAKGRELTPTTLPVVPNLESVEVGMQEDGRPWRFPLAESHAVVGGVPGSGKSVFLNVLLAGVSQRPDVQIVGIDCAGGVELEDWSPRFSAFATDQDSALEVLRELWGEHERRIALLRRRGFKSLTNMGFSEEMPLLLVVIDEAAQLFRLESTNKEDKAKGNELVDLATRLVTVARKTGIVVVLATQKPMATTLPTLLRDNAQVKVSFRVVTEDAARAVLGASASSSFMSPTEIRRDERGVAIAEGADGELTKVRSFYISEESDRTIARQYAHLAKPLAWEAASHDEEAREIHG